MTLNGKLEEEVDDPQGKDEPEISDSFFADEGEEGAEPDPEEGAGDPEEPAAPPLPAEDDEDDEDDDGDSKDKLPRSVYQKIQRARMKRDAAKEEADAARAENAALRAQIEEMKDPEPDLDDDPHAWKAWKERDVARKIAAPQGRQPAPSGPPPVDARGAELAVIREAFRREHPDYDRFVNPAVLREIDNDPVVYDIVWVQGKDNPVRAAYEYGKRRILGQPKKPEASGGGSAFASPRGDAGRTGKVTELTPWQKGMARKFNMTDKQMLDGINAEMAREK